MLDGSHPLWGHDCVLKGKVGMGMFKRSCHQLSKPRAATNRIANADPHHMPAHRVSNDRSPGRVNQHLAKFILNVYAAKNDPSAGTVRMPKERHS